MKSSATSVLVLLAAFASACVPATATLQAPSPTVASVSPTADTAPPTATQAQAGNCYYVWSSQDLPTLSQELRSKLGAVDPAMSGSAYAYGEDCVAADGSRTFSPMETDFQIRVEVDDLADKEGLGNAIGEVMAVVAKLPSSQLEGPQPGRAEFEFVAAGPDTIRLNVEISSYDSISAGLQGARLFDALQSAQ